MVVKEYSVDFIFIKFKTRDAIECIVVETFKWANFFPLAAIVQPGITIFC